MKKFFALLCAGVLACSMSMAAFAAPSQTTGTTTPGGNKSQTTSTTTPGSATGSTATVNTNGHSTVDSVKVWSNIIIDGVETSSASLTVEALPATSEAAIAAASWAVANNGTVLQMVDVKLPATFSKVTIPFNLTNVMAGQNIIVLHLKADGQWEQIVPDKVENGKVTVTFSSLSPVIFVSLDKVPVKAPKTGDSNAVPFAAATAVLSLAGAAFAARKFFN
mgnify:FL=1